MVHYVFWWLFIWRLFRRCIYFFWEESLFLGRPKIDKGLIYCYCAFSFFARILKFKLAHRPATWVHVYLMLDPTLNLKIHWDIIWSFLYIKFIESKKPRFWRDYRHLRVSRLEWRHVIWNLQQTCDYRWFPCLSKFDTVQLTRVRERLARNLQLLYGNGESEV